MYTEVITPSQPMVMLTLPEEMVGKKVTIKAEAVEEIYLDTEANRRKNLQSIFDDCRIDLSNFKFDRNEANNYEKIKFNNFINQATK